MKSVGYIALAVGALIAICSLFMNVSVPVGNGVYVNNLGLMAQRQAWILAGGFVALAGLLVAVFADKLNGWNEGAKCPYCAESVSPEAVKCKHCQSDITPTISAPVAAAQEAEEVARLDGVNVKYILGLVVLVFVGILLTIFL